MNGFQCPAILDLEAGILHGIRIIDGTYDVILFIHFVDCYADLGIAGEDRLMAKGVFACFLIDPVPIGLMKGPRL